MNMLSAVSLKCTLTALDIGPIIGKATKIIATIMPAGVTFVKNFII